MATNSPFAATKQLVARSFNAARDYADHARIQRRVAERLARQISALPVTSHRGDQLRLLEIGCGTGFLTQALHDRGLGGQWLVTDIAPSMVSRCAAAMERCDGGPALQYAVMDGEWPTSALPEARFDVICSSLAFQWFSDLGGALARLCRLIAPHGTLIFSTLIAGTFSEWLQASRRCGMSTGGIHYPSTDTLLASFPSGGRAEVTAHTEIQSHDDARAFLRSIKRIGAGTAHPRHKPLLPGELRRVMAQFDQAGASATYRVATAVWTRDANNKELTNCRRYCR